ncbi:CHAP domain-containing protein, partial [Kitasatospora sp. NPDC004289]
MSRITRLAATATLSAVLLAATAAAPAFAATPLGNSAAAIAAANTDKGPCSTNSAGGTGFLGSCSGHEWCADFAKWTWSQAGAVDTGAIDAAAYTFAGYGAAHNTFHWVGDSSYTPQPGDAVIWAGSGRTLPSDPKKLGYYDVEHVNLVESVVSRTNITTIGGNERNGVRRNPGLDPTIGGQAWGQKVIGYISPVGAGGGAVIPAGFTVAVNAGGGAASGQSVSGTVSLTALASASGYINTGRYVITGPGGYTTGQVAPYAGGASNYPYVWNTAGLAAGTYQISFIANEIDGRDHTYGPATVTVAATQTNPPVPHSSSSGLAAAPNGGYVTTWRGTDGKLWMGTGSGTTMAQPTAPWLLGVAQNTKPSVTTLSDGTWAAAWVGDDGKLWLGTGSGTTMGRPTAPWQLGVFPGTSPSITALTGGGWEVAWKGDDGKLWLATGSGTNMAQPAEPWLLGVADTTSPSLAALPGGGWEVAWKGDDGKLWLATGSGSGTTMAQPTAPWQLGVDTNGSSSSPSLVTMA